MVEVLFNYKGFDTIIQCNKSDKMKDIINKYIIKSGNKNNFYYLYSGEQINEELRYDDQANEVDKERKKMNILVYDKEENINNYENNIIKSKDIICPECHQDILVLEKFFKNAKF